METCMLLCFHVHIYGKTYMFPCNFSIQCSLLTPLEKGPLLSCMYKWVMVWSTLRSQYVTNTKRVLEVQIEGKYRCWSVYIVICALNNMAGCKKKCHIRNSPIQTTLRRLCRQTDHTHSCSKCNESPQWPPGLHAISCALCKIYGQDLPQTILFQFTCTPLLPALWPDSSQHLNASILRGNSADLG